MVASIFEDDAQVIEAAKHSSEAFARLYQQYNALVHRYARRLTGSSAEADEVTAQTFAKAFIAMPKYEWRGVRFDHWLFRIAHNTAFDARQTVQHVSIDIVADIPVSTPSPETVALHRERVSEIKAAVDRLPPRQRRVIYAHFSGGLTYKQIAQEWELSEGAVKQLVHRALVTLRELLAEPDVPDLQA